MEAAVGTKKKYEVAVDKEVLPEPGPDSLPHCAQSPEKAANDLGDENVDPLPDTRPARRLDFNAGELLAPVYYAWEITESWQPLIVPIFHNIAGYLNHDQYLLPETQDSATKVSEHVSRPSCTPYSHLPFDPKSAHLNSTDPPIESKPSTALSSPHPRPRVCLILHPQTKPKGVDGEVLSRLDVLNLGRFWHLPNEVSELLSYPDLNPGFSWKRTRMIDGQEYFQTIFCYSPKSTLVTSYNMATKETRGVWFTHDAMATRPVLNNIPPSSYDLQHPFCVHRHLVEDMAIGLATTSKVFLNSLINCIQDLNKAFSSGNSDGDDFEGLFLKASRSYLFAKRSVFPKLDEANLLINLIRDGLANLEKRPHFWTSQRRTLTEVHGFYNDRLDFIEMRIQGFRRAILARDEQLQKSFGILHELINMRDGRVSKAIAETSEEIARDSKRDSSAMKTLAVLTTVFLPPTFIATIFSTPFFNFTTSSSVLSSQFWIYWAVSIPLTIIVIILWLVWYRWSVNRHRIEDEQRELDQQSIFAGLAGRETGMHFETEFEFVRKKKHHFRKTDPSPLLTFLAGGRHEEEDSNGSIRKTSWWRRLFRRRRSVDSDTNSSRSRSLVDD